MLTKQKRRILFYISISVFLILALPVLFFTLGYRIGPGFDVQKTGGIFIQTSQSGTLVSAGGRTKHSSIIGRSALIKNLAPGSYEVLVKKDGFWDWKKMLAVRPEEVISRSALLIPMNASGRILGTSTPALNAPKPPYSSINKFWPLAGGDFLILGEDENFYRNNAFIDKEFSGEALAILKTVPNAIFADADRRLIFWEGRNIDSLWLGDNDKMPSWQKERELKVFTSPVGTEVRGIAQYPGWPDYLLVAYSNGIFAMEMEPAGGQNIFPIYKGKKPNFMLDPENPKRLIASDDGNYLEIELQ